MKKKVFFIIISIFVIIFLVFFIKNNYKNFKMGNNKNNKSVKEVEEYILNINSYTATIDVSVESNKNSNKYILKQEYEANNFEKQTVIKPENIEGTEIIYNNETLELKNTKLNLNKVYTNYPYLSENSLWLSSFKELYKSGKCATNIYEENEYIVMQVEDKNSNYTEVKKLYLEQGTGLPKKMTIQNNNKKDIIYILYKEIIINK